MAIVPMKKMLFVSLAGDGKALLRKLQELQVLHPEHVKVVGESDELQQLEHKIHVQKTVIKELEGREKREESSDAILLIPKIWEVEGWIADERRFLDRIGQIDREVKKQLCWGYFNPDDVRMLEEKRLFVQLWDADKQIFDEMRVPKNVYVRIINSGKIVSFVTVAKDNPIEIENAEQAPLPNRSLDSLDDEKKGLLRQLEAVSKQIDMAVNYLPKFRRKNRDLENERDFYETLDRAFDDESLMAFAGWVPGDDVRSVKNEVKGYFPATAIKHRDPKKDESPPVKTRNPWIARVFEPLMHILGFPKYRGVDPALFFAPSMMLFFGICLGDAGYGVVMVMISLIMRRFLAKKIPGIVFVSNMTLLFGAMTILWGLITGSVFGISFSDRGWILLNVAPAVGDPMILFKIAIGIGVIHLTIALLIAFFHSQTIGIRMAKLGTIIVLWGGVLGLLKIPYWWLVLGLGLALILSFSSDSKNPLIRIGLGLWSVYGLTSLLGDVMSYARLFGLGVATGAIASVVNVLAADVRNAVPGFGYVLAIAVLLVGHSFNFAMGIIGALVHPARLHAVEAFPKCVELTGTPYKPLARQ